MAGFAIMRCKKIGSMGSAASALQHAYRERKTDNADHERTPDNDHRLASSTDEAMGKLRALLPEKRRKDAVVAVEYVMSASPEWWETATSDQQQAFFDKAHGWLADKYGADRVIVATVHRDETTPHLSAFVVPLTQDGRLSAKEFIGSRAALTTDQTSFAAQMRDLGLERGLQGSTARHTSIQAFYAAMERPAARIELTEADVKPQPVRADGWAGKIGLPSTETHLGVAQRLQKRVDQAYGGAVEAVGAAQILRRTAKDARDSALALVDALRPIYDALLTISPEHQRQLAQATVKAAEQIKQREIEERRLKIERERQQREIERAQRRAARRGPSR